VLEIQDDGVGLDPALLQKKTFGLVGIGERALVLGGKVDIDTAPGKGTKISVSLPQADSASHAQV
jgi:signal transduction histidine kinase